MVRIMIMMRNEGGIRCCGGMAHVTFVTASEDGGKAAILPAGETKR
jgi:hypothetical protein